MIRRAAAALAVLAIALAALAWFLTAPKPLQEADLPQHTPDLANGERMFNAGGCASCHAPVGAKGEERYRLAGGLALTTAFGTFNVPNISPDPTDGIGGWTVLQFANALSRGVSPEGRHYYPSFPYASYARMKLEDVIDLKAYLDTLPAIAGGVADHDLRFPYSFRRGVGVWKLLYLSQDPVVALASPSDQVRRGQYLVEGPSHCGECHTPRDFMGGMKKSLWLAGAPNPEGRGRIPNITPHADGIADWSEADLVDALTSGITPDFDDLGGAMASVVRNLAELPKDDVQAIAAYLKAVPAHSDVEAGRPAAD